MDGKLMPPIRVPVLEVWVQAAADCFRSSSSS